MAKYRPVCSRWNKLSRTNDYWKALCVKDMGPNISPIRLYQGAKISTEASAYVIPITKEGTKVAVDFMSYYRIRRQFVSLIHWFNSVVNQRNNKLWQGKGTDLTLQNIRAFIKIPWATLNIKHSNALAFFLFLIIPPLLMHGHEDLAQQAFKIIADHGAHQSNMGIIDYTRSCMKIHQRAKEHNLPELAFNAFEAAGQEFQSFMGCGLLSEDGAAAVFDSIVTQIIRYGAESQAVEQDLFDFHYPEEKYAVLSGELVTIQFPEEYAIPLVSIARREFEQASDWRVKATALATAYSLPSGTAEGALHCLTFAMDVLKNDAEHDEVKHAAMVLAHLVFYNWHKDPKFLLPPQQYVAVFQLFTNKLVELPPNEALIALRIVLLLSYSVNVLHDVIDDQLLDKFHENLLKILTMPAVISNSITPVVSVLKKLRLMASTYGNRLTKYLKKYREVLFTLARNTKMCSDAELSPEEVVASYVNLLCAAKEFHPEAVELVQQIENKSLDFTVRLPQFYAVCGIACSKLPGADVGHIIESIFEMLPAKFAAFGCTRPIGDFLTEMVEKIKAEHGKQQEGDEEDEEDEEYDSEDEMDMSNDGEPQERTDFLPYLEAQFRQAVERSKSIPKENTEEYNKCFQFSEPTPAQLGKTSDFVEKINLSQVDQLDDEVVSSFHGCQTALTTVLKLKTHLGEGFLPYAQKTFHLLLGYCRTSMYLHPDNITDLQSLFKMISPYLDGDHRLHYSKIFISILLDHLKSEDKLPLENNQAEGILSMIDMIMEEITPIHIIPRSMFVNILDTLTELLNQAPISNAAKALESKISETFGAMFRKWPKNSIPAFIQSKICAWISEAIRESEEDTASHMAALLMCCHIGLRFGIAFIKMSLALGPGSVLIRPYDLLDFLEQGFERFNPDGTLMGTKSEAPSNAYHLLRQTILLFQGALVIDEMDMLNCYRSYTFDSAIVKEALLSGEFELNSDIQELVDNVVDDKYMDLIFPKE